MDEVHWPLLVAAHTVTASLSMVLGAVNLLRRPRGDRPHRVIGRTWVGLMYFTALSSFWIQELRPGNFSLIHGLSVFVMVTLTLGWLGARNGDLRAHVGNMVGSYLGTIGAFVFVVAFPDRHVPQAFQQDWLGMTLTTAAIVAVGLLFVAVVTRLLPEPRRPAEPDRPVEPGPVEPGPE